MKRLKFLISLLCFAYTLVQAQTISIYASDLLQTIDMIGGDMERSSKAVQTTVTNTEDVIQWGFGDINFNYCRVQFDKKQELTEGVKNWASYANQVLTMKQIKALNPDIKFYATMRSDYDGYGDENNMPDWIVNYTTKVVDTDKYAIFLADYLEYMADQGVSIHTLATHKEWGAFVNATKSRDIILKLKQECSERSIPMPQMNDNGAWSMAAGLSFMNGVANLGTQDLYAGFSSHEYASNDTPEEEWPKLVAKASSLGKKLYQDETITGASNTGAAPTYRYAQRAVLYQSGLCGEIFFEIWSRGIDKEVRSIYWKSGSAASRLNGYYVMKHFANNVLGSRYVKTTAEDVLGGPFSADKLGGITQMAFRKGKIMMLWVINHTSSTIEAIDYPTMNIRVNSPIASNVQRMYWNSESAIEGSVEILVPSTYAFTADIKANSINAFTFYVNDNSAPIDDEVADSRHLTVFNNTLVSSKMLSSYNIYSLNGSRVKSPMLDTTTIDISKLSKGVYIFEGLTVEDKVMMRKFVKK